MSCTLNWMEQQKCKGYKNNGLMHCKFTKLGCSILDPSSLTCNGWEVKFTPEGEELRDTIKLLTDYVELLIPTPFPSPGKNKGEILIGTDVFDPTIYLLNYGYFSIAYGPSFLKTIPEKTIKKCTEVNIENLCWEFPNNAKEINKWKHQTVVPYGHISVVISFIGKSLTVHANMTNTTKTLWKQYDFVSKISKFLQV